MGEKTAQWMFIHACLMLAVGLSTWLGEEVFMLQAAAAFSFGIYYVLLDLNRRDLLLTKANAATTARLLLTLLLPDFWKYDPSLAGLMAGIVLAADGLDGYLARRYKQSSEAGARLDAETDALFVLMLSVLLIRQGVAGPWLIGIGLLRYLWFLPVYFLRADGQKEQRYSWAKYFAVFLMASLSAGLWLSPNALFERQSPIAYLWQTGLYLSSLGVLYSFGRATADFILAHKNPLVRILSFWLLALGLSTLLAAPVLLLTAKAESWTSWLVPTGEWLFWSLLLLSPIVLRSRSKSFMYKTAVWLFLFLLLYQMYRAFYLFTYGENPVFLYDYLLLRDVVPVFFRSSNGQLLLQNLPLVLSLPAALWVLARAVRFQHRLAQSLPAGRLSWSLALIPSLLLPAMVLLFSPPKRKQMYRFITPALLQSLAPTGADIPSFAERQKKMQALSEKPMGQRPDIYWIFVEAYGAVAQLSQKNEAAFRQMADSLEARLAAEGWQVVSAYSQAPIMGGRSWLSFTTALSGLPVKNQRQYLHQIRVQADFPHFPRYLKKQGYTTFRLSTMYTDPEIEKIIPRDLQNNYWSFDQFIGFHQIPYRGFRFDYFGGIPDQYALSYTRENHLWPNPAPRFLFAISMSSHYPYYLPPPVLKDWRALDSLHNIYPSDKDLPGAMEDRYFRVVRYELEALTQFILEEKGEDVLFILLGDHQPAGLEALLEGIYDSYATPLHLISRDSSLLARLPGFSEGFALPAETPLLLKHEDLAPLLMKWLQQAD